MGSEWCVGQGLTPNPLRAAAEGLMDYSRGERGTAEEPLLHPLHFVEHGGPLERHVERTPGERNRAAVSGSRSRWMHPAAT